MDLLLGIDPTEADRAWHKPGSLQPVRMSGIGVRYNQRQAAIRIEPRRMIVDANAKISVVERFHPVVVDLKIPVVAIRDAWKFDYQRFVGRQPPVGMVVKYIRAATSLLTDRLISRRQLIHGT